MRKIVTNTRTTFDLENPGANVGLWVMANQDFRLSNTHVGGEIYYVSEVRGMPMPDSANKITTGTKLYESSEVLKTKPYMNTLFYTYSIFNLSQRFNIVPPPDFVTDAAPEASAT